METDDTITQISKEINRLISKRKEWLREAKRTHRFIEEGSRFRYVFDNLPVKPSRAIVSCDDVVTLKYPYNRQLREQLRTYFVVLNNMVLYSETKESEIRTSYEDPSMTFSFEEEQTHKINWYRIRVEFESEDPLSTCKRIKIGTEEVVVKRPVWDFVCPEGVESE